jgi:hypothetical protein
MFKEITANGNPIYYADIVKEHQMQKNIEVKDMTRICIRSNLKRAKSTKKMTQLHAAYALNLTPKMIKIGL